MNPKLFLIAIIIIVLIVPSVSMADECYAAGDINDDGVVLTVADLVALERFLSGDMPDVFVAYEADLNGDCMIDDLDLDMYNCYFEFGLGCFVQFPVPTCCEPSLVSGACCFPPDSCKSLSPENCALALGIYHGGECSDNLCCCNLPGDANNDEAVNILDVLFIIAYLYEGGPEPECRLEAMAGGTFSLSILDITSLIAYLYQSGPPPICGQT